MKVPGRAWLAFHVEPDGDGSWIHQTAVFDPRGIAGRLYWWSVFPLHALIFGGMLRRIAAKAVEASDDEAPRRDAARSGS